MAIDLTGITNENEFYTHHYLAAILEELRATREMVDRLLLASLEPAQPGEMYAFPAACPGGSWSSDTPVFDLDTLDAAETLGNSPEVAAAIDRMEAHIPDGVPAVKQQHFHLTPRPFSGQAQTEVKRAAELLRKMRRGSVREGQSGGAEAEAKGAKCQSKN